MTEERVFFTLRRGKAAFSTVEITASLLSDPLAGDFVDVTGSVLCCKYAGRQNSCGVSYVFRLWMGKSSEKNLRKIAEDELHWFLSTIGRFLIGRWGISHLLGKFGILLPLDDENASISILPRLAFAGEMARAMEIFLRPFEDLPENVLAYKIFANPYLKIVDAEYDIEKML